MNLYRATPVDPKNRSQILNVGGQNHPGKTRRRCSYLVENIWEFLRPVGAPSRQNAIFVSPTAKIAMDIAEPSPTGEHGVWEVELHSDVEVVICPLSSAAGHKDVSVLEQGVSELIKAMPGELSDVEHEAWAPLFKRHSEVYDLYSVFGKHEDLTQFVVDNSRYWKESRIVTVGLLKNARTVERNIEIYFNSDRPYKLHRVMV